MPTRPAGTDILDMSLTDADLSASNLDGLPGVFSMRTLGTGSQQAAAGDDPRFNSVANDPNPSFLVLALTSSLNNERVLSGGLGINILDLGSNSSAILDLNISGTNIDITTGSDGAILLSASSGGGITELQHKALRHLIHFIDDGPAEGFVTGAYKEIIGQPFPTTSSWYTDSSKTELIVQKTIERTASPATNVAPTPIIWRMYDVDGSTVLATVQDDITYSGVFEINRTRTIT